MSNGFLNKLRMRVVGGVLLMALTLFGVFSAPTVAHPVAHIASCPIFTAGNAWNRRVDRLPALPDSERLIAAIGLHGHVHNYFSSHLYDGAPVGIPYTIAPAFTPRVHVHFLYAQGSDRGAYPITAHTRIEAGPDSDRHAIIVDPVRCLDYELFDLRRVGREWTAGSGAIFNLRSDRLQAAGSPAADGAGLPILPGLVRHREVAAGSINHALRFTAPCTAPRFVYPARHFTYSCGSASGPPMGLRVRLKRSVNISRLPYQARVIALALKRYGMILSDNGPAWSISGVPNWHWNSMALHQLWRLSGSDFEAVASPR